MFIEDYLDNENIYKDVEIEEFENEIQVREMTRKESQKYNQMMFKGMDKVDIQKIIKKGEKDVNVPLKTDIVQFQTNKAKAEEYLIQTCFQMQKKDGKEYVKIPAKAIDRFTDKDIEKFIEAYNNKFDIEQAKNFPESEKE